MKILVSFLKSYEISQSDGNMNFLTRTSFAESYINSKRISPVWGLQMTYLLLFKMAEALTSVYHTHEEKQ